MSLHKDWGNSARSLQLVAGLVHVVAVANFSSCSLVLLILSYARALFLLVLWCALLEFFCCAVGGPVLCLVTASAALLAFPGGGIFYWAYVDCLLLLVFVLLLFSIILLPLILSL